MLTRWSRRRLGLRRTAAMVTFIIALILVMKFTSVISRISNMSWSITSHEAVDNALSKRNILTFLSLSYHAAPVYDLMDLLQPFGVRWLNTGLALVTVKHIKSKVSQVGQRLLHACTRAVTVFNSFGVDKLAPASAGGWSSYYGCWALLLHHSRRLNNL